jgi:hypothetical protein
MTMRRDESKVCESPITQKYTEGGATIGQPRLYDELNLILLSAADCSA